MLSLEPLLEVAGLAGGLEDEDGRALHAVVGDGALHAAGQVEHLHPAVVRGDERALRRRHRDEEVAVGVLAVDRQRPGDAERDLRDADEALDVALQRVRVERVVRDVLELRSRELLHELLPLGDGILGVVVLRVARDADPVLVTLGDGVLHLERELSEVVRIEADLDLMHAVPQRRSVRDDMHDFPERERNRAVGGEVGSGPRGAVGEFERETVRGDLIAVDADLVEPEEGDVGEPVFEAEAESAVLASEAAEGVELAENERRDFHGGGFRRGEGHGITAGRQAGYQYACWIVNRPKGESRRIVRHAIGETA